MSHLAETTDTNKFDDTISNADSIISTQTDTFDANSTVSLNNQVNLVLKDYDEKLDSVLDETADSIGDLEISEACSNTETSSERLDSTLRHIEDTARKGLSKYFEKNVLKFKIKLTFDEPVYLTDDIYMDELSVQDEDLISVQSTHTEVYRNSEDDNEDEMTETSVIYEMQEINTEENTAENRNDIAQTNNSNNPSSIESATVKLGVFSMQDRNNEHDRQNHHDHVEANMLTDNVSVMSKVSDLVDLFVSDDVIDEEEDPEETVEIEYLHVEAGDCDADSPQLGEHEVITIEDVEYTIVEDVVQEEEDKVSSNQVLSKKVVPSRLSPASDLETVNLENTKLLILNNSLIYTANDGETSEMITKEFEMEHKHLNTKNFQHLNNAKNNNLNLDQTNVKQSDNLEKLRLENFQHLTTTTADTEPNISSNKNNAEESIEVEYIKYTGTNSTKSVQTSKTFSLLPATTAETTTDGSEVTLTIMNEHTLDDKDSADDVSCDLDDLSCTVDYFLTDDNETHEDQDKSEPVISANAGINLPCLPIRAIDDYHSQQLSQIVDIFTDQI